MKRASGLALVGGSPVRRRPFPAWPKFGPAEERRLLRTLRSGNWGRLQGGEVAAFERRFASMHGCRHGLAVVNGTVSLRIALLAAGIGAEAEVIVPAYTFVSTASAVVEANAVPVFADIDLETFNVTARTIDAVMTPRTRAIIPVHFAGQPAEMAPILELARRRGLFVLEDAAHAHGAVAGGRPAGSLGHAASFSFQSSKNLTCGEGGVLTTNDAVLAESCRSIHNCGRSARGPWYEHHVISGNYRLGEFQGAVLNGQLGRLEQQTRTRDRNGIYLAARLRALPGVYPQRRPAACERHSYHLFMVRLDAAVSGVSRGAVLRALQAEGIPCSGGYAVPLPRQPLFRHKAFGPYLAPAAAALDFERVSCPNSERICRAEGLWIEQRCLLGTRADTEDIARAFEKVWEQRAALQRWERATRGRL
jgi:dTDP-4-amino-4,6-dideoxygalactose transaminase